MQTVSAQFIKRYWGGNMDQKSNEIESFSELFAKSKAIIRVARDITGRVANLTTVISNFEIGRYIVEEEQKGKERAGYGTKILDELATYLTEQFGRGFSRTNVASMRKFYLTYRERLKGKLLDNSGMFNLISIVQTPSAQLDKVNFPFKLTWSHYQVLMRIENDDEREFYEKEAIQSNWDVRTLKRQYSSSLYERLAMSRDKARVKELAEEGITLQRAEDVLKSPFVLEFLGLDDKAAYHESDLESAIINKLQKFLLELGKGFLFEARQKRFTFQEKNFFVDLVFYNRLLNCYVLIDLKVDELTHQDLGQMQMYVNYFDRYVKTDEEKPTVGILLCKDSDEALVELTLPENANIYAKEYKLYLPDKATLQNKLREWLAEEEN